MKIIAAKNIKIKLVLFAMLFAILGGLAAGTGIVYKMSSIDASYDKIKTKTVIIDPGHGGIDGGTSAADGTLEKDINLKIALKLNDMLNSMGIKTVLTRTEDISIHDESAKTIRQKKVSDIKNRLKIINNTDNAIFVSIHQNYFSESKYSGTQVFYSKNNSDSAKLADSIRLPVISYLQPENSRETKSSGTDIYLLYHAQVPAVMVECGFLSNQKEADSLKDEAYQNKMAFLIAIGIFDFFNNTEDIPNGG